MFFKGFPTAFKDIKANRILDMKMIIQTPDFKASEKLTEFIQEKAGALESFSDRIIETWVWLRLDNSNNNENKMCEIKLVIPGNDLFASKQSHSFEDAIVRTVDAVKRQLEQRKAAAH